MIGWIVVGSMAILFIACVVGALAIRNEKHVNLFEASFVGLGVFAVAIIICCAIFTTVDENRSEREEIVTEKTLVISVGLTAMKSASGIEGNVGGALGLVYGEITNTNEYVFLYKTEDGGYKKIKLPAEKVTLYELPEGTAETPRIEEYDVKTLRKITVDESQKNFFKPFWRGCRESYIRYESYGFNFSTGTEYKVYVPAGSIVSSFDAMG